MYDKVSERRELLFFLVTQVGYIVKKTEFFFTLSINVSLSLFLSLALSLGKPS
jgi:hypothetical protein